MPEFPTSVDDLIHYVERLHPDGAPLDYLGEAMTVSSLLADQADELLGHFVERARRSGQSWTEIGTRMGVSKQAVRKRFVPRWDGSDPIPQGKLFSRFTLYARRTLLVADAMARRAGTSRVDAGDMAAALLSEVDGLAAIIITNAGISSEDVHTALGVSAALCDTAPTTPRLEALQFTDDAMAALRGTHAATLRLGHNYVGTEHLLLGLLSTDGATSRTLTTLGLDADLVERAINDAVARIRAERGETPQ
ncbi:MAG TPA: Clp protease N-terminal domain-containing protein [Mycobacterium sp.]